MLTRTLALSAALTLLLASAVAAQSIETNCPVAVDHVDSCSYEADECWIETQQTKLPWMPKPAPPRSNKNPKLYRAFCSPSNATFETDGQWYSYSIYLPEGYDLPENQHIRYPVVYWTHGTLKGLDLYKGRGTNLAQWVDKRMKKRHILPTIYVVAYGGVQVHESGVDGEYHWIDQWTDGYLAEDSPGCDPEVPGRCFRADSAFDELIEHIDANYRTVPEALGRGIQGFSRGGGFALYRGFRKIDGEYPFGSIAGLSAGVHWQEVRFSPDLEDLVIEYANEFPNDRDRDLEVLLKWGDLAEDISAEATEEFSVFLNDALPNRAQVGVDPFAHSAEHVVPACGEERNFPGPCPPNDVPPVLAHQQPRLLALRGDEVIAFHQANFARLPAEQIAALNSHVMPCAANLGYVTEPPNNSGQNDDYLAGDWDGDGCDTIAARHEGEIFIDNDMDHKTDERIPFGPHGVRYFAIDWRDVGYDEIGYAEYRSVECPTGWEIRMWTDDRDRDGHGPEDEPFFCFPNAPEDTDFLIGDFNGDWKDDVSYRHRNDHHWATWLASGYTGDVAGTTRFGKKTGEDQYAMGVWSFQQPLEGMSVRRHNDLLLDEDHDGRHDIDFKYGTGSREDQYLYGDWNGDGRTNVGVRRCNLFLLDITWDGSHDHQFYYGLGTGGCRCDDSC